MASRQNLTVQADPEARSLYPNIETLYEGDQGIYRGCGPNNGVCHNSREFPNLASLGGLVGNIGLHCNEKRQDPTQIHDLCERQGDLLRADGTPGVEIAAVLPYSDSADTRTWRLRLRDRVDLSAGARWSIVRPAQPKEIEFAPLTDVGATLSADTTDPTGRTISVLLPKPAEEDEDFVAPAFIHGGVPGDPQAIQVGDPNGNGIFGASLGGKIIAPGDPARSYLFTRLTDPAAGPLMPRANCCFWTKASLRALWCWVAGLRPDGSNAFDPIAYDRCPPGPLDTMEYPTPGPKCETSGMCPVKPRARLSDDPTFSNVYEGVLKQSCSSCHSGAAAAAGLEMGAKDRAYTSLVAGHRVIPGNPPASTLFVKISPDLCRGDCTLMPKRQPPLDAHARSLVERWIQAGAKDD
jgi:hypothetical protein